MTTDATKAGMIARRARAGNAPPLPKPEPDVQSQIDALVTSYVLLNERLTKVEHAPLEPVPQPSPSRFTGPTTVQWLAILAVIATIAQYVASALRPLPASTPVTIALIIVSGIGAAAVAIEQVLEQQGTNAVRLATVECAHLERMEAMRSGRT
jgi:hypothetical protein